MSSQVETPVRYKMCFQSGTPIGLSSCIKDGFNSPSVPQPLIPENWKCWKCINEFGSETIAWTHADPLSPPDSPPKYITLCDFLRVPYFNSSQTTDEQTPLDIETRDNVAQEVVGEVSLWGSLVDAWIDSRDPSA